MFFKIEKIKEKSKVKLFYYDILNEDNRIIYKADGSFRSLVRHGVKNWIGYYEHFFTVVLGTPTNYDVKPIWSKRILKVGHNRIIIEKRKKPENS